MCAIVLNSPILISKINIYHTHTKSIYGPSVTVTLQRALRLKRLRNTTFLNRGLFTKEHVRSLY